MPCNYSCVEPAQPESWSPNNDISGIGVVISYIATAGIAVLIISIYYVTLYQPTMDDPFKKSSRTPRRFRPNPVDELVLSCVRRVTNHIPGVDRVKPCATQLDRTFMKCILAMSDLQIVTGFSIFISGSLQLRCGLTTFYWQIVVYLAWFSSITHLSCLTLLRNHLYTHATERRYRLLAMGILATTLIVGIIFTGNYGWNVLDGTNSADPWDFAICYLRIAPPSAEALGTMLASVLLIAFAFIARVIKVHRKLSVDIFGRARAWLSTGIRTVLRIVFVWCGSGNNPRSLKHALCYRPLLAIFLAARLLADGWSSTFLEVLWLLFTFGWGINRLIQTIYTARDIGLPLGFDDDSSDWTFGQVVAIVLLVAPFITIFESYDQEVRILEPSALSPATHEPSFPGPEVTATSITPPNEGNAGVSAVISEDPDNDWDYHMQTLGVTILYVLMITVGLGLLAIRYSDAVYNPLALFFFSTNGTIIGIFTLAFIGFIGVILFSLMIETHLRKQNRWYRNAFQFVNLAFFLTGYILALPLEPYSSSWNDINPVDAYYAPLRLYLNPDIYAFVFYTLFAFI